MHPAGGDRAAQLVRRVGDELALLAVRRVEPGEHVVHRRGQLVHLVVCGGTGTRSLRLVALIACVRAVIARTGRRARPATSQVIAATAAVSAGTANHSTVRTASSPSDTASSGIDTPT